jgi:hypothetical protein
MQMKKDKSGTDSRKKEKRMILLTSFILALSITILAIVLISILFQ